MMDELRLADGTPVRVVGDIPIGEWTPVKSHVAARWDSVKTDVYVDEGVTLTQADIDALIDKVDEHYSTRHEVGFRVSQQTYWMMEYARQGKRYPSLKKRKSKARMSKKWRSK